MPIEFQWLGPSPFHAKFFVYSSDGDDFQVIPSRGYNEIIFSSLIEHDVDDHVR